MHKEMEEDQGRQQGTSFPEVEYMGTVHDGVDTTLASQSETVQDSTDDLQHQMGIAEQGDNNSLISAGYADAQAHHLPTCSSTMSI